MFRDMIESARKHIRHLFLQLLEQRKNVFKSGGSGDFENGYFDPELVKLKYDCRSIGGADGPWTEDGQHFGCENLLSQLSESTNNTSASNFLIEVDIKS